MVGKRLLDLFASSDVDAAAGFVKEGAPVNDELVKIARDDWASTRHARTGVRRAGAKPEPAQRNRSATAAGSGSRAGST